MSGRGGPNTRTGRGGGRGRGTNDAGRQGDRGRKVPTPGGRGGFGSPSPSKGLGRGTTPVVKVFNISQNAKDDLIALEKERDKIKELQFENGLKKITESKKLKDLEGSEILVQREITKFEQHNTKSRIDDTKLVESLLKKHKDEYNVLLNEKKGIKKALDEIEKEETTLNQRFEANKNKLEKKKEDLAKERQNYYQRQTDKSKNLKVAAPEKTTAKVDPTSIIHPCQLEINTCVKLISILRRMTEGERRRKPQNGNVQPEEKVEEEPKSPSDDQILNLNWVETFFFERISCIIPKTIGEAKALIPVIQDRKIFFHNLGVPPEKRIKKTEKNGTTENPEEPAAEELDTEEPDVEEPDVEEPDVEELDVEPAEEGEEEELVIDEEEPAPKETPEEEPAEEEPVEEDPAEEEPAEEEPSEVDETVVDEDEVVGSQEEGQVVEEEAGDEGEVEEEQPAKEEVDVEDDFTLLGGNEEDE